MAQVTPGQGAIPVLHDIIATGELQGSATALQLPDIAGGMVGLKAVATNAGKVYIGAAGVTVVDGTTDVTSGYELAAGDPTLWMTISNLNILYRICDNAGDDLIYMILR